MTAPWNDGDKPACDERGIVQVYLEYPAKSGSVTYTGDVSVETLVALLALLAEDPRRPLASREEVSRFLDVPVGTLTQWAHKHIGPEYFKVGRWSRYRWSDVDNWLATRRHMRGGR
ncbi:helix-turn-helix transcriptional regulator [Amycolatopsis sp. cmx-4-68]|uniref:helix-turn-helix transcriptional regulator n=1 Tax=Amycolatopsis sp. cmx-4-68 TaxID=2790938 RepID=UPI00397E4DFC